MTYTPVPAVAAGDWIDEIFINTYWVDNFAASLPDLFSAKGQLGVGLGVDSMGILNVGTNGQKLIADSTQALGMKWGDLLLMDNRQGGGSTSWIQAGTTNFIPPAVKIQFGVVNVGSISTAFNAIFYGQATVTFPVPFTKPPFVIASFANFVSYSAMGVTQQVTASFVIFYATAVQAISNQSIGWVAIGEA